MDIGGRSRGDSVDSSGDNVDVSSYKTDSNGTIKSGERSGVGPEMVGTWPGCNYHDVITTRQLRGAPRARTLSRRRRRKRKSGKSRQ